MSNLLPLLVGFDIDLQHRGLGYKYQRLTNSLVSASGASLTWPPSITKHRCAMSEVSLWVDDRGLVGTQAPQSRAVTCFNEETMWSRWATYVALGNGCE